MTQETFHRVLQPASLFPVHWLAAEDGAQEEGRKEAGMGNYCTESCLLNACTGWLGGQEAHFCYVNYTTKIWGHCGMAANCPDYYR